MKTLHKNLILSAGFMLLVACGDNKPSEAEVQARCMASPGCRQAVMAASAPMLIPMGAAPQGQVPGQYANLVTPGGNGTRAFSTANAINKAIAAKNLKVAAALDADRNNPLSDHYVPPQNEVIRKPANEPLNASAGSGAAAVAKPANSGGGGGGNWGEIAR